MATGVLLQPEFVIAYLKKNPQDPRFTAINEFFDAAHGDFYPTISSIAYGLARESIQVAKALNNNDKSEMARRLRSLRREQKLRGNFYDFDSEAADEWAIVRQKCATDSIKLDAERQVEYAIALAKNQAILAAAERRNVYLAYPSLVIEYR